MKANWKKVKLKHILSESKILSAFPSTNKRITVRLNVNGVEKRENANEKAGATKQYIRKAGQFIYGRQNFHKGAFGIVPPELDGYESSADIPAFDISSQSLAEWVFYYFKSGNRYLDLDKLAVGVGSRRISPQKFLDLEIPLPSLEEQKDILEKLKARDAQVVKLANVNNVQLSTHTSLRQQILQDAITGKLSEKWRRDNPNIESADVLLEKIKAEKEKLVKEGKIKKQKPLPPITENEIPFEIPEGWVWCRLEDVGLLERGKSKHRPRNDESLFVNGVYPFVQTGDVARSKNNNYQIETYDKCYNEKGLLQSRLWNKGTLCITIAANIAETGFLSIDACFPDSVVGFTSLVSGQIPRYVKMFIDVMQSEIEKFAPATAQKNINLGILNQLVFSLPPLAEQQYIVERIESLFAKLDRIKELNIENHASVDLLNQVVLKEMFAE